MGANDPQGGSIYDPRCMVGRIYKEDHYTLLHTNYESSAPCGFREENVEFFYVFPMTPPGRGLYGPQGHGWKDLQREPSYVATNKKESSGPCGFGEEDFFYVYHIFMMKIVSQWELMTPWGGAIFTPGAWLAGFIKRTTIHC